MSTPPFSVAFHHATPHGVISAVHLPTEPIEISDEIFNNLPPQEREHAQTLKGFRQMQFIGGRIALRHSIAQLGMRVGSMLPNHRGAPQLPEHLIGSISHKDTLAVGMAARATGGTLGVDLESYEPERNRIARKVLTEGERVAVDALPDAQRWFGLLIRFSLKESLYKALDPVLERYIGFDEAEVHPDLEGKASIRLLFDSDKNSFEIDARYDWVHQHLLTSVRIRETRGATA